LRFLRDTEVSFTCKLDHFRAAAILRVKPRIETFHYEAIAAKTIAACVLLELT
jgi:hypothetical protein